MVTSVGSRVNSTSFVCPVLSNRKNAPKATFGSITVYDRGAESELMGKLPLELKSEKVKLLLLAADDWTANWVPRVKTASSIEPPTKLVVSPFIVSDSLTKGDGGLPFRSVPPSIPRTFPLIDSVARFTSKVAVKLSRTRVPDPGAPKSP